MRAGNYNITCEAGATFRRTLEIEQPDLGTDPTGQTYEDFSLEGYTARMQVRRTIESTAFLLELTTENGGLTINPADELNQIYIDVAASVTASLANNFNTVNAVYDLEIINGDGIVSRMLQGTFIISPEVTR
jgi:hypothetical protein